MTYPPASGEIAAEGQRAPALLLALVPERLETVAGGWTGAAWGWTLLLGLLVLCWPFFRPKPDKQLWARPALGVSFFDFELGRRAMVSQMPQMLGVVAEALRGQGAWSAPGFSAAKSLSRPRGCCCLWN